MELWWHERGSGVHRGVKSTLSSRVPVWSGVAEQVWVTGDNASPVLLTEPGSEQGFRKGWLPLSAEFTA